MTSNTYSNDARDDDVPTRTAGDEVVDDASRPSGGDDVLGAPRPTTTEKDPSDWVTGDEPMTGAQRSYLDTLAREAGEELPADLTKAQASEQIDRLQDETGRDGS
ncbi:hypothetical protein N798_06405 [Knoellia flava TL1]|uniref:DUF3072 domain-containing protein n=2 Tax=Knoellia flava TaxID=913969 RepID=A0A8H9FR97_9MICO|nr:DUF3072 domain-containing protein [Knoellia flava]KGN33592.1 hypothetical protein N798_06405 [Knoellia flava TL1]GGB72905.1 hypothetical protein GCM10011314_10500 [Knoellia flava]